MTTTIPMYKKSIILSIAIISLFIATRVSASESTQLYVTIPAGTQRLIMSSTTAQVINTAISAQATTSKGVAIKFSSGTGNDENNWPACSTHNLDDYTAPPNVGAYTYFNGSVPITNAFTPSNGANYIFFWAIPGGGCDYAQPIGYIVFTYAGGGSTSPSPDYEADLSTRVISIHPNEDDDGVQATSTDFQLWSLINVNIDDYVADDDWFVRFKYIRQEDLQLAVANTDLLYTTVDVPITQWPNFEIIEATTTIDREGVYLYSVQIRTPSVINNILGWFNLNNVYDPGLVAEKSGQFIVGQRTTLDQYIYDMASTTSALISDPGTFSDVSDNCNPISGFSALGCITALLVPNQTQISSAVDTLKSSILTKAPVGYVTRVISIMTDSATTSLPDLNYTFGNGPLEGQEFHFEPNTLLASADTIIREDLVSDQDDPQNLWDIFMPIWNTLLYAGLLMMIVSEVTGMYNKAHHKKL